MSIKKIILILLAIVAFNIDARSQTQSELDEYLLKAAFIYRFTDYVEWQNPGESDVFTIGILGDSPISNPLLAMAKDKKAKNKTMVIRQNEDINALDGCQLIFMPRRSSHALELVIAKLAGKNILIVTEQPGSLKIGAQINFITFDKLRFEVNIIAARSAGLKLSSQLLQHAYRVVGNE